MTCQSCQTPAEQLSAAGLCCSCEWMKNKDALCETCDHADPVECEEGCLVGGYHCRYYHRDCDMMRPYQYEMFEEATCNLRHDLL